MKVIKRDGREVAYDRNKIVYAIHKANNEVEKADKISEEKIYDIIASIENRKLESMAVEDIQDIIEQKLMEEGKYNLAKKYIIYRYTRALVRKSNTTDDSILRLIRGENSELKTENSNKNSTLASTQRDYIAGKYQKISQRECCFRRRS